MKYKNKRHVFPCRATEYRITEDMSINIILERNFSIISCGSVQINKTVQSSDFAPA